MDILLHPEIFVKYFEVCKSDTCTETELNLISIIRNKSNRIVLSSLLRKLLDKYFEQKYSEEYFYSLQTLLQNLVDNERVLSYSTTLPDNTDIEIEFKVLYKKYPNNFLLSFVIQPKPYCSTYAICIITNAKKPNYHWCLLELCAKNVLKVSNSDFKCNLNIELFFKTFYSIPRLKKDLFIFDAYCNIPNICFKALKDFDYKINYYSSSYPTHIKKYSPEDKRKLVKKTFGDNSRFSSCDLLALVHRRTIAFNDLIITSTHDFNEIRPETNWILTVEYSNSQFQIELKDNSKYS
ncbi:MAG: hypothetical protein K1X86_05400 [Ignavibacteria bacterium]|nr:hypothetical protein [Ignavibacteria bacterium]